MKITIEDIMPDGLKVTLQETWIIDTYEDLAEFIDVFVAVFPEINMRLFDAKQRKEAQRE